MIHSKEFRSAYLAMTCDCGPGCVIDGWAVMVPIYGYTVALLFEDVGDDDPDDLIFVHDFFTGAPLPELNFKKSERRPTPEHVVGDYASNARRGLAEYEREYGFWNFLHLINDQSGVINAWPEPMSDADAAALEGVEL